MPDPVSILIADDHEVVRRGVRLMLERIPGWSICAEASTGREAVALAKELRPSVVVLDLHMPELNGLEATRQIKRASKETEVLIFSGSDDEQVIRDVYAANARSYILKTDISTHLVAAITALAEHRSYFTPFASEVVFAKFTEKGSAPPPAITPREREIVQLLAEGKSNKDLGALLGISVKTVETHRAAIMRKMGFDSFADLVRYAIHEKLVGPYKG